MTLFSPPSLLLSGAAFLSWAGPSAGVPERIAPRPDVDPKDGPDVDLRIAIENGEVRMQIITNLAFLDEMTDIVREMPHLLDPMEAPHAMEVLFDLFKAENEVEIDGAIVPPLPVSVETSFEFDPGDESLYPHFSKFGARAVAKTRLTVIYPCTAPPDRVSITWGVYPPNHSLEEPDGTMPPSEVTCRLVAGGIERIVKFSEQEPQFIWHREASENRAHFADVPGIEDQESKPFPWLPAGATTVSILGTLFGPRRFRRSLFGPLAVVFGAVTGVQAANRSIELPTEEQALTIFEPLHENIYRAFAYTDESDVYDALSQSVDGRLLERLYDEVYRSLVMQEEGGAVSRVEEVRHLELDVDSIGVVGEQDRAGFEVTALWQVDGVVFHWGHAHSRTNEYRARYTVHAADGGWRIADSEVLAQRRVDADPLSDLEYAERNGWTTFEGKDAVKKAPPTDF